MDAYYALLHQLANVEAAEVLDYREHLLPGELALICKEQRAVCCHSLYHLLFASYVILVVVQVLGGHDPDRLAQWQRLQADGCARGQPCYRCSIHVDAGPVAEQGVLPGQLELGQELIMQVVFNEED